MFSSPLRSSPAPNPSASHPQIKRPIISPTTTVESTLPRPSASAHFKRLAAARYPLESTLTKKPGAGIPVMVNQISRGRACCAATVQLRGSAWVDTNTFQVVRLKTDLRDAHPKLRLKIGRA